MLGSAQLCAVMNSGDLHEKIIKTPYIWKAATMVLGLIGDQVLGVSWVVGSTPTSSAGI